MNGENTWSASASVSVPFTLFERKYSSSTTVSTGKDGGTGVSTGISGALNDRFSYGLGGGRDSDGGVSSYLNAAYSGDRANLNGTVNHSSVRAPVVRCQPAVRYWRCRRRGTSCSAGPPGTRWRW